MSQVPERRAELRDECRLSARIEIGERLAVTVGLADISTRGVRLRVADAIELPAEFDLLIPLVGDLEQRCRVKAIWRRNGAVGGAFLSIGGLVREG